MEKVFLIDGSSVFFRSYHAIPDLHRSDGMLTNALYGYLLTLRNLFQEYHPKEMIVAFDLPEQTFRKDLYEAYKANRVEPPEDLVAQIPYIKEATDLLGITQFELPGYEADDLIGTIAKQLEEEGKGAIVVSADKDLLQLVNNKVSVLRQTPRSNQLYGEKEVQNRFGVSSEQLVDYFALMGDSSDNIPGVPGIGEKTARDLIQQFGSLESLYDNLDQVKGKKRKETLEKNREMAYLSRQLVEIKRDVDLHFEDQYACVKEIDPEKLYRFYMDMEFRSLAEEIERDIEDEELCYETVGDAASMESIAKALQKKGIFAVDTETTSLNSLQADLVGISISVEPQQGWYFPLGHLTGENLTKEVVLQHLGPLFESEEIGKVGHNIKYDLHILENAGFTVEGIRGDTLIASCLVQPEVQSRKLDDLAFSQVGMKMTSISDLIGKGKKQLSMAQVPVEVVSTYACEDTDATWRLHEVYEKKLNAMKMRGLYEDLELPLLRVLADMETRGVRVDPEILQEQSDALGEEIKALERDIYDSVGREFNINSPLQLAEILYDDLQLLSGRKRTTRADILEKLANEGVGFAQKILDYRHRKKIKSTYLDALHDLIDPKTGRVHTTYSQTVAQTGRISSSDPNLQNIPIRTDLGRRVRRAFLAADGYLLISLDYSQIELRILAHIAGDEGLKRAFLAGEDIHRRTAADIFDVSMDDVTPDMRRKAKEVNFGLNYGMSPYGLAKRLGIPEKEAQSYIETYFQRYPMVQQYMDQTVAQAKEQLYVTTIMGRRISTAGINQDNRMRQDNAKRAAINAPIQGSAAELLKVAMIRVSEQLQEQEANILLTVHDELILEVKEDLVDEVAQQCRHCMENAMELSVPIPVEISIGTSWADLK